VDLGSDMVAPHGSQGLTGLSRRSLSSVRGRNSPVLETTRVPSRALRLCCGRPGVRAQGRALAPNVVRPWVRRLGRITTRTALTVLALLSGVAVGRADDRAPGGPPPFRAGFRALASYRPNDPGRQTVCLVHGMNSSSGSFIHM